MKQTVFFRPPYFAQGSGYAVFCNPIGDGYYPVVKKGSIWHVVFDFSYKPAGKTSVTLDEERLEGKLLGRAGVDSGSLVAVDSSRFSPKADVHEKSYCRVKVEPGEYVLKFIRQNYAVSIRKA